MSIDWGNVPGRADDYGYGYYVRVDDFDSDGEAEVMINDRRFAWLYGLGQLADCSTTTAPLARNAMCRHGSLAQGEHQPRKAQQQSQHDEHEQ